MEKIVLMTLFKVVGVATLIGANIPPAGSQPSVPGVGSTAENSVGFGFCSRTAAASRKCPTPPTVDTIDLRSVTGIYYEIGSTARYKFRNELAMVCSQTNFTFKTPASNIAPGPDASAPGPPMAKAESPATIMIADVEMTAVPAMYNRHVTLSALYRIATSAADVCANAARMCRIMDGPSKLSEAMRRLETVSDGIFDSSRAYAGTLALAEFLINASSASVYQRLDGLSRSVNAVARIVSEISQSGGSIETGLLLSGLRLTTASGARQMEMLSRFAIANLTYARGVISHVARQLSDPGYGELLMEAAELLDQEIELISSQVAVVQGLLSSIGGPLSDIIEADERVSSINNNARTNYWHSPSNDGESSTTSNNGTILAQPPNSAPNSPNTNGNGSYTRMQIKSGQLIQNSNEKGSMVLKLSNTAMSIPFNVIAGEGDASTLLIFSCVLDANGDPNTDLILLSRYPYLAPEIVINIVSFVARYGVFTDCDIAFVPTLQGAWNCGSSN